MTKKHLKIFRNLEVEFTCKKCGCEATACTDDKNTIRWIEANKVCWHCRDYTKLPYIPIDATKEAAGIIATKFSFFEEPSDRQLSGFFQ